MQVYSTSNVRASFEVRGQNTRLTIDLRRLDRDRRQLVRDDLRYIAAAIERKHFAIPRGACKRTLLNGGRKRQTSI